MAKNMGFLACFRNIFGHPERHDFSDFFFLTPPPKNDENVKKSKNREHFIISVLKVGQGKNFLFLSVFIVFQLRQNVLIFFKILNHRWRSLTWFHRCFWAQTNFFVKFIYKIPRKHLQNPWHSYHNFWQPKSRYRHKPDHLPPPEYWLQAKIVGSSQPL